DVFDQLEWPGPDALGERVYLVVHADRHDRRVARPGQVAGHSWVRRRHAELDGVLVGQIDAGDLRIVGVDAARRGRRFLEIERVLDRVRRQLRTVVELRALAQVEDPGLVVWRLPRFGQ